MDTSHGSGLSDLGRLSTLGDPVRQQLYAYIGAREEPVSREDAAAVAGISRTLAAYHLDKLAEAGLLTTGYARPEGRGGPGAGRPAKRYALAQREISVTVPPRNYALLAGVLTDAVHGDKSGVVRAAANAAARKAGERAGRGKDVMSALQACGYEPAPTREKEVELHNCPFHQLAREHTDLVCGLNLELVKGMVRSAEDGAWQAELAPQPGRCCVRLRSSKGRHRGRFRRLRAGRDGQGDRDD